MGKRVYNEAKRISNERYDSKTYKQINFRLRLEDDADIIESILEAQENGISNREWLRQLFENK